MVMGAFRGLSEFKRQTRSLSRRRRLQLITLFKLLFKWFDVFAPICVAALPLSIPTGRWYLEHFSLRSCCVGWFYVRIIPYDYLNYIKVDYRWLGPRNVADLEVYSVLRLACACLPRLQWQHYRRGVARFRIESVKISLTEKQIFRIQFLHFEA